MDHRIFVPLRFVSEALGAQVNWDAATHRIDVKNGVFINRVTYSQSVYLPEDPIKALVEIHNASTTTETVWLGYSLFSPLEKWIDLPVTETTFQAKERKVVSLLINKDSLNSKNIVSGSYSAVFALWDTFPITVNASRLAEYRIPNAFRIYSFWETFNTLDQDIRYSRYGRLGRSQLNPRNVTIQDNQLQIKLPARTLQGCELQTIENLRYGSYEISMQLPNAPSSITGFFLYKAPDFYHEIDIEIYNHQQTEVMFTSYAEGRVAQEAMYLMVNTWYPTWLEGTPQSTDRYLKADWIRY